MVQEVLGPSMQNSSNAQIGLEVVPTELQQSGRGAGKQERVEPCLVVLDERVQFMRECEHDVEVRNGQHVPGLLLQPLGTLEPLATRAVPVATGVRHEVFPPALGTPILVATQRRSVTGGDGTKDFPVMAGQTVRPREVRQCLPDNLA